MNKKDKIYIGGLSILGLTLIILIWMYSSERKENKLHVAAITIEKTQLENELEIISQNYDLLETNNDSLNVKLDEEKGKIIDLLKRMKKFKNDSYSEINRYKKELGTLKHVLRDYIVQIDSLNSRNKILSAENVQVKKQISWVKEQNLKLEEKSESLKEIVSKASALEAFNLNCYPINQKGKAVQKVLKTKKLKADFTLNKNITTPTGAKMIYMRITRPDEVVLSNPQKLLFEFEGKEIDFTAQREIDYEGEQLDVSIFWDNNGSLIVGNYTVDIFVDGYHIGTSKFNLK